MKLEIRKGEFHPLTPDNQKWPGDGSTYIFSAFPFFIFPTDPSIKMSVGNSNVFYPFL